MSSHYSSMHIHGVRIVIVGPGAAHNFLEKAKKKSFVDRHCDGGMYAQPPYERQGQGRVQLYDDETILQDHPGKDLLPIARIRPDVCSEGGDGGVGRGLGMPADGEEDKDDPSSKWSAHVAKAGIEFRRHMESPSLPAGTPTPPSTPPITHLKTDVSDVPLHAGDQHLGPTCWRRSLRGE